MKQYLRGYDPSRQELTTMHGMRRCPMSAHTIEITEGDAQRLRQLLACLEERPGTDRDAREVLRHKLDHAHIVSTNQVGRRVVTLQSRAVVEDDETWELMTY